MVIGDSVVLQDSNFIKFNGTVSSTITFEYIEIKNSGLGIATKSDGYSFMTFYGDY